MTHAAPLSTLQKFETPKLISSNLDWEELAIFAQKRCAELEKAHPGLTFSMLLQECGGLRMAKNAKEESTEFGAPFPAKFTGSSVVISARNDHEAVEWASNAPSLQEISAGFEKVERLAANLEPGKKENEQHPTFGDFQTETTRSLSSVSLAEKKALVEADFLRAKALAPMALNWVVRYEEFLLSEMFVSAAKKLRQQITRVDRRVVCILPHKSGRTTYCYVGRCRQGGFEQALLSDQEWKELEEAIALVPETEPIPPGEFDVILDGDWAGLLAHEAFGHGAEGDMIAKNRSRAAEYLGKMVGSELVSMADDASLHEHAGAFFFDNEGTLCTNTLIIDKGKLVRPMTHLSSAGMLNISPSSNGRRESPLGKVYTRMTNTYFLPGKSRFEDMLASVKHGFYLQLAGGGMEDPKSWGIQCEGQLAREIRDGKFTGKVYGPVCLTGYVPDLLASVKMVEDGMCIRGSGFCGKGYKEWVKVSSGGPHMLMRAKLS